jgi:uncharacterized membrane protein
MLAARMFVSDSSRFSGLFGNLLLAWIPLLLSLFLRHAHGFTGPRRRVFWFTGILWILFYPNSFYIVTDLIHINKFGRDGIAKWYDMMLTASHAFAGVFIGSLSLYLLHLVVRERFGYRVGWVFATIMLALGSIGIYVGRFLRWNSWDVLTRPGKIIGTIGRLVTESQQFAAFAVTFFFFSLMAYFFVVAMARLHELQEAGTPEV